jgi:hypothetical protein
VSRAYTQVREEPVRIGIGKQCSAIREVVFAAGQKHFSSIIAHETRRSRGQQVDGSWKFLTERFETKAPWQGASRTFVEHSTESTDTSSEDIWQYIAEYKAENSIAMADAIFADLNRQIIDCPMPVDDTAFVALRPVPATQLPLELPPTLLLSFVYAVPQAQQLPNEWETLISILLEKTGRQYKVTLIVEKRFSSRPRNNQ